MPTNPRRAAAQAARKPPSPVPRRRPQAASPAARSRHAHKARRSRAPTASGPGAPPGLLNCGRGTRSESKNDRADGPPSQGREAPPPGGPGPPVRPGALTGGGGVVWAGEAARTPAGPTPESTGQGAPREAPWSVFRWREGTDAPRRPGGDPRKPPDRLGGGWPLGRFLFSPGVSRKPGQVGGKWGPAPRKAGLRSPVQRVPPTKAAGTEGKTGPDGGGVPRKPRRRPRLARSGKRSRQQRRPGRAAPCGLARRGRSVRAERRGAPGWTR